MWDVGCGMWGVGCGVWGVGVVTKDSVSTEWTTISFLRTLSFCRFNTCASSYPGLKAKALLV